MGRVKEVLLPHYERLHTAFMKKHRREPSFGEDGILWEKAGQIAIAKSKDGARFIWVAQMESSHFSWICTGLTKPQAIAGLRACWDKHIGAIPKAERGDAKLWDEFPKDAFDYHGGVCRLLEIGEGYKDYDDVPDEVKRR